MLSPLSDRRKPKVQMEIQGIQQYKFQTDFYKDKSFTSVASRKKSIDTVRNIGKAQTHDNVKSFPNTPNQSDEEDAEQLNLMTEKSYGATKRDFFQCNNSGSNLVYDRPDAA